MTTISVDNLNQLPPHEAEAWFEACCASVSWYQMMAAARPYTKMSNIESIAKEKWALTKEDDWLEAFEAHPMIGDINSLRAKFNNTKAMAGNEQSGTASASEEELQELHELNLAYKEKFGFIFIICATGLSAGFMLNALKERISNTREQELLIASQEQLKIALLRIGKGIENGGNPNEI